MSNSPLAVSTPQVERRRFLARGLVQGVGFRPHVYRLARRFQLGGFVRNSSAGVVIEVEGLALDAFADALRKELPPLARIDSLSQTSIPCDAVADFSIQPTVGDSQPVSAIPADMAVCDDCLHELFDPANRRHLHPFIACCNCGPRYTMARHLPYDRSSTAMADFELCANCSDEYQSPEDRRFHAEPIGCHQCGPVLSRSPAEVADALAAGKIVAVKGVGGYHLACDARNAEAVALLRKRKKRDGKPFALMVLNAASASAYVRLDNSAEAQLCSPQRPVVVLPRTNSAQQASLSPMLAPGLDTLGIMLPYTPLHYLLFYHLLGTPSGHDWLETENGLALVMTSANISGEPLVCDAQEAEEKLAGIADLMLHHNRPIERRVDDSVVLPLKGTGLTIRRARGFTPNAVRLAGSGPTVLALGAHLKNTVTLTRGDLAHMSSHIGDLDSAAAIAMADDCQRQLRDMLQAEPAALACDLHPDYASTRLAESLAEKHDLPLLRVQHHHAHAASVLACHGHNGPALAVTLDGHGMGLNGESWGGELLLLRGPEFQRLGHLYPLPVPGGDRAAREPWRMAAGVLHLLGLGDSISGRFQQEPLAEPLADLLASGEFAESTSAGRLFDAAAGLLGVCLRAQFEADAPMRLEAQVNQLRSSSAGYQVNGGVLDFRPLLAELSQCPDPGFGAELFHGTLVKGLVDWVKAAADESGISVVALGGGCFLNRWLGSSFVAELQDAGLKPLLPQQVPVNDGGISLGQAWIARQQLELGPVARKGA